MCFGNSFESLRKDTVDDVSFFFLIEIHSDISFLLPKISQSKGAKKARIRGLMDMLASYPVWPMTIDYNPNSCKLFTCVFYRFETWENGEAREKPEACCKIANRGRNMGLRSWNNDPPIKSITHYWGILLQL